MGTLKKISVQKVYFVLDFETGILQYFVNEQSKNQKPRGAFSLAGAIISPSDEAPHMLVVYSANGEMYKLRGTVLLTVPARCCFCTLLFLPLFSHRLLLILPESGGFNCCVAY
uniref:Uncharacterized protein n=1 Tax=Nothoprocta perdicaria TaxID=30464 RepID=A0A8C6ZDU4_NOTPE